MKLFHKRRHIVWTVLVLLFIGITVAGIWYVNDYYRASTPAIASMESSEAVTVEVVNKSTTVFAPQEPIAGLIFYPGGKVEHTAYAPLMQALAERGILCVLVEMPLRLAVLDTNAAEGLIATVTADYPTVTDWYMAGHSLGGSMAASYAASHTDELKGLVLLAAYSTADLTDSNLDVLSIVGSEDGVLNREKYAAYKGNLPDGWEEETIEGGNHAGFGDYGAQAGDGTSALEGSEQICMTAELIRRFISP